MSHFTKLIIISILTTSLTWSQFENHHYPGAFHNRHFCDTLDYSECLEVPFCIWDEEEDVCLDGMGNNNLCADLGASDCEATFFCLWDEQAEECYEFFSPGMGWGGFGWGHCMQYDQEECDLEFFCEWNMNQEECVPSYLFDDPCAGLSQVGCNEVFFCHWNELNDACEDGFGGYDPCTQMNMDECSESFFCFWDMDNEMCMDLFGGPPSQHFQHILNGHLADYIHFADTTGYGVFQTITIESIEDGDLGDEIGFLDYNGLTGFGDCTGETGEILVGAAVWNGAPLTVTTFGALDFCSDGDLYEIQIPGWVAGNPIGMVLWKVDEDQEYLAFYDSDTETLTWSPADQYIPLAVQPLLDLNSDGSVDVLDILIVIDSMLGNTILEPAAMSAIDINGDSFVDILDIVIFIHIVLDL